MATPYPPELQTAWANVVARAWKDPEFLKLLTHDPKTALESEPENPHHCTILSHGGAVFPLPPLEEMVASGIQIPRLGKVPERLEDLNEQQLAAFADQEGFFGHLRFT